MRERPGNNIFLMIEYFKRNIHPWGGSRGWNSFVEVKLFIDLGGVFFAANSQQPFTQRRSGLRRSEQPIQARAVYPEETKGCHSGTGKNLNHEDAKTLRVNYRLAPSRLRGSKKFARLALVCASEAVRCAAIRSAAARKGLVSLRALLRCVLCVKGCWLFTFCIS